MLSISATLDWRITHPGAVIGLLELSGVVNIAPSPRVDAGKREIESHLRERYKGFSQSDFLVLPVIAAYDRYYRRFNKTYHVQLQLESIVLHGKNLPDVSPLVDSNFMAELDTLVLTAVHDTGKLKQPIVIDVSRERDQIVQMNGAAKAMRAGDMVMRDAYGVSCSIIYGQDNRSPISTVTTGVLYVAYAPAGIPTEAVEKQLAKIEENVLLFSPQAVVEQHSLLMA